MNLTHSELKTEMGHIHYLDSGGKSKPVMLFIHGNSSSHIAFRHQCVESLTAKYRLIMIDLPGHGQSSTIKGADSLDGTFYSIPFYVNQIQFFLNQLEIENPYLVGHSLGGHIAIWLAKRITVSGLVASQAPPLENLESLAEGFAPLEELQWMFQADLSEAQIEALARLSSDSLECQEIIKESALKTDPLCRPNITAALPFLEGEGEVSVIKQLSCPVRLTLCPNDRLVSNEYIVKLGLDYEKHVEYVLFDKSGHFPQLEEPQRFNKMLSHMLQSE